jgi:hypothetical protein
MRCIYISKSCVDDIVSLCCVDDIVFVLHAHGKPIEKRLNNNRSPPLVGSTLPVGAARNRN